MNTIVRSGVAVALFGSFFWVGCGGDAQPEPIIIDSTQQHNRAIDVRKLNADEVFLRLPKELLEAEGLERLDDKARKELVSQQRWGTFQYERLQDFWVRLSEEPQSEDDATEKTVLLQFAFFTHQNGDKFVLAFQQQRSEEDEEWLETQSIQLWQYDGKSWEDMSQLLPAAHTAHFFAEGFNLKGCDKDFLRYEPSTTHPAEVSISLQYHRYGEVNKSLREDYLVDNEKFKVSWIWNGQSLQLQQSDLFAAK